jgi:hypothetical protein
MPLQANLAIQYALVCLQAYLANINEHKLQSIAN